jgi:capsule polysaccharide export protein KpsE/RkpR
MSDETRTARGNTISLLDLVMVLVRHRWFIILSTFVAAILILAYSIYSIKVPPDAPLNWLPNVYRPTVQVRLQDTQSQSLSSFISNSDLGFLANLAGGDSGGPSSADLAQELLIGNTLLEELAGEFNLVERLEITENPISSTRKFLKGSFESNFDASTGILTIGFENTDRLFATDVLNSALAKLEARFKSLTLSSVTIKKQILEQSIVDYGDELRAAQQALIDFQRRYGIISIELQTEYKLEAVAEIDSQILGKQSELRTLEASRRENDPEVRRTRMEIQTLQEQRQILINGNSTAETPTDIPQSQLPELSARYLNLTRDLQIVQTIYSGLRSQYESLKVEEMDTSNRFQIIEEAEVPELKSGPSRSKICIIFTMTIFFLAVFVSFILEYFARVRHDPIESGKLSEIKRMLGRTK